MKCRRWPDFLILGAAKSGTTSLYRYLSSHPEVYMPSVKEPRFFAFDDDLPDKNDLVLMDSVTSEESYLELFDEADVGQKVGEASPIYLAEPRAVDAIYRRIPDAKLIVILRDPVERAFSHFLMSQRQGYEPEKSFIKALTEPSLMLGNWKRDRPYLKYSRYGECLERYLAKFPREQLLVLMSDQLQSDEPATLKELTDFIGVSSSPSTSPVRENVGYAVRSICINKIFKSRMSLSLKKIIPSRLKYFLKKTLILMNSSARVMTDEERKFAITLLIDDIQKVERLLGKDLTQWRI